ncbi:BglG family transcription antiterminator [Virgibacillus halotolerans]|uniref:BglG family transcription antiterminator n=1 Tax=Virgibacillus halotolerans TaxID=1071053 RepID=UPI00195F7814|nr:PRD domain-containing protein [Virgibacillus halotolerans]
MYIPGRERKVIELLLHADAEMTVKEVAGKLEVSERTIHRDLKSIEKVIAPYQLELIKKAGVGLRMIGKNTNKQQLELALSSASFVEFTPEERQAIMLSTLFETNEPIKLFTLADELKVTIATVSNDLTQIEETLADFHLTLIRRRGYGVKITGDEADKRAAINYLITQHLDPFDFVSLIKENIQKKSKHTGNVISDRLLGLVNPDRLNVIEKRVEQTRSELPYELADSAHVGLVVHLALAIERLQKGDTITFDPVYLKQIEETKEYQIAGQMIHDLKKTLHMDIPDDEIGYITMHLLGAKLRLNPQQVQADADLDIRLHAKALIRYIGESLDVDFSDNTTLLHDLVAHLKPAIYRLEQGMHISNPLIEQIRNDYDDLFHLVQEGAHAAFPDLDFPDDEIGYLVLHFAAMLLHGEIALNLKALVICSSGIGTAKMLANKIMQVVPEIKQVDNASMFDVSNADMETYDLIVSTIPLQGFDGKYILASPMLTEAEVQQIKKAIRQRKLTYQATEAKQEVKPKQAHAVGENFTTQLEAIQNYTEAILSILKAFRVTQLVEADGIEKMLSMICDQLEEEGWLTNNEIVLNQLLKRERISGLGIPGTSLALYHTRSDNIAKPHFSIYRLREPLTVAGMDGASTKVDTLLIMLAPEAIHQEALEVLSYLSSVIIQDQTSITLFESGDEAMIKQFLSEEFHQFLQEKNLL